MVYRWDTVLISNESADGYQYRQSTYRYFINVYQKHIRKPKYIIFHLILYSLTKFESNF